MRADIPASTSSARQNNDGAAHTAGPWEYRDTGIYSTVATTQWRDPENPSESDFVCVVNLYSAMSGNAAADARLMAAAPELLEALKGVLSVADRNTVEFDAARAAIKKATGT